MLGRNKDNELTEASLLNEELSATVGNSLEADNSWYTPGVDAGIGFASSFGGFFGGISGIIRGMGTPVYLPLTAGVSAFGSAMFCLAGVPKDRTHFQASDYVKCGLVVSFAILASTGTMTGGAAIAAAITNSTEPAVLIGTALGTSAANMIITPVASSLFGFGLFKARECLQTKNIENDIENPAPSSSLKIN